MRHTDTFSSYHPLVNFVYFILVLGFSMTLMHPVCLLISLSSALSYIIYLQGRKAVRFSLQYLLPLFLLSALVNPLFSHEGGTILLYLPSGNPLTLESVLYGLSAGAMLVTVIIWFSCYQAVMTSDKFIYLFGRIVPSLSLLLSMTLRLIPQLKSRLNLISSGQKSLGQIRWEGGVIQRAKSGLLVLSVLVSWSLEHSIETADSMKSRGYGLPGRTAFSLYRFDARDKAILFGLLLFGFLILVGAWCGGVDWRYYPTLQGVPFGAHSLGVFFCYWVLCITPLIINVSEDHKWNTM